MGPPVKAAAVAVLLRGRSQHTAAPTQSWVWHPVGARPDHFGRAQTLFCDRPITPITRTPLTARAAGEDSTTKMAFDAMCTLWASVYPLATSRDRMAQILPEPGVVTWYASATVVWCRRLITDGLARPH